MKDFTLALLLSAALSSALPQEIDWDAVEALKPIPTASIPIVSAAAAATTFAINTASAVSAVSSAVLARPSEAIIAARHAKHHVRHAHLAARDNTTSSDNSKCPQKPAADDTPDAFLQIGTFAQTALKASAPAGYSQVYVNKNGSSEFIYPYMGFTTLSSYDTAECSKRCDAISGCQSINIYFERDPSIEPTAGCTNPASSTVIKCVYWGSPVTPDSTTNTGQWRKNFKVLVAGSNGYVNTTHSHPKGYDDLIYLNNSAIIAPPNCRGYETYMGVKIFQNKPFSIDLCASACSASSEYNRAHPDKTGYFQTCQFFNTYILYNETRSVGQYCALYNETWGKEFATNFGQWRNGRRFTLGSSWMVSNSTGDFDKPRGCANGQTCE
ncbi:hypothetical protein M409DRAFT_55649 [Zasmidium cellare ATCC 36951]|uniref:Apple domain-containing protein n=1 Tax=Zasmidium cellare ATCC 36951 TaxID=1080233 RepID=A0A6A6CFD9_ZASCE|nr:uncharacterized protein M409DRAFT_55649 [Zasmidium cellare ATCC 36951]KAF2165781.1 hypothetical protein M409DRAFT_55649 [Zasmidium cellare ATCC 36951]